MNNNITTATCMTCSKPVDVDQAIAVRLTRGRPNAPGDKWGYKHRECATPQELAELGLDTAPWS